jgi:hypothetical protein
MKQHIRGLEETIRKLTRTFQKYIDPSFLAYENSNKIFVPNIIHRQQMGIHSPNHYMV